MNKILALILIFLLSACSTPPKVKKPDVLIHEDVSPTFHYQVWEREDGVMYIKELYRGTTKIWD